MRSHIFVRKRRSVWSGASPGDAAHRCWFHTTYSMLILVFIYRRTKRISHFYLQTVWVLAGLFILIKKKIFKIFKGNRVYTNARLIFFINQSDCKYYWQVLMWFPYKSSFLFCDWLHSVFLLLHRFLPSLTHIARKIKRKQLFSIAKKQTFRFISRSDH